MRLAKQLIYLLIVCTITACVPTATEPIPTGRPTLTPLPAATPTPFTELIATGRPTLTPPPTVTPLLLPLPLHPQAEDVQCEESTISPVDRVYEGDQIVPGQSTKVDVLALLGEPYEISADGTEDWWLYRSITVMFRTGGNVVTARRDPRHRLNEIVAKYGVPAQLVWQLPNFTGPHAISRTCLLYPQQGVFFVTEHKLTIFANDTFLNSSRVVEPSQFEEALRRNGLFHQDRTLYTIDWPCPLGNE